MGSQNTLSERGSVSLRSASPERASVTLRRAPSECASVTLRSGSDVVLQDALRVAKSAVLALPRIAREALYFQTRHESFRPPESYRELARLAVTDGVLRWDPNENVALANADHASVKRALAAVGELARVLDVRTDPSATSPLQSREFWVKNLLSF